MQSISIVKDYNSIFVQSITPLKSFISKREFLSLTPIQSILEFKVEWEIDKSKTWEPWSYVRKLQALRDYIHSTSCKNKVLKKLVPTNIIEEEVESDEEFKRELDAPYWH